MKSIDSGNSSEAVGAIPSGLFIVSAADPKDASKIDGFLASWIQQISFDPLMIMLAVKEGRPCYDSILNGGIFSVNIVADEDKDFLKHFWKGYDPADNPFDKIEFSSSPEKGIVLGSARMALTCKLKEKINPGDHCLVMAEVLDGHVINRGMKSAIHSRKNGLQY